MRKFSSYGPLNIKLHYYAARKELLNKAYTQLVGENPEEGGHYITVWAPRQTGKSWAMLQIASKIRAQQTFDVATITMEFAKYEKTSENILEILSRELRPWLKEDMPAVTSWKNFSKLFTQDYLTKPLILFLDEFDSLEEEFINKFASEFRGMYMSRISENDKESHEKRYLLHGLALIGVRSVLGIENVTGSPFNVQRSLHIPNLTFNEVEGMFKWYEQESGQKIDQRVIEALYDETQGQPGLTCWLGELLTEGYEEYHVNKDQPITMEQFEEVYEAAIYDLPNNNILNIISKAKKTPYKDTVLELFKTDEKVRFRYDDSHLNYLYLNGIIDREKSGKTGSYVKFACPFVQKRLFNYFSGELFSYMGRLVEPFENLEDTITEEGLNIRNLVKRYQDYLHKNREWLLKDAPRRKDLRIYEAVFHFNLYMYLVNFLRNKGARVYPEFPTGNGTIDLIIHYRGKLYGIELKSYTDHTGYKDALKQAALYGKQLALKEISLVFFVESLDEENRKKYETDYVDQNTGIRVMPIFVETGN
jgi:hypothetical protein